MKRTLIVLATAFALSAPGLGGCDKTVHEETTVKSHSDGSTTVDKTKVTEGVDGSITKTREKQTVP